MHRMGWAWLPHARGSGYDGDMVAYGVVHISEIKNPLYKWHLTRAETKAKIEVEASGGTYNILETVDDVLRVGRRCK